MTNFFIPLRRALSEDLLKGWERGPAAQHKYIRRTPSFSGGKMHWTYWYADTEQRASSKPTIDPEDKHIHRLLSEQGDVHENLKSKMVRAALATTEAFKLALGFGGKPARTQVIQTKEWTEQHHATAIAAEAGGALDKRSPNARI